MMPSAECFSFLGGVGSKRMAFRVTFLSTSPDLGLIILLQRTGHSIHASHYVKMWKPFSIFGHGKELTRLPGYLHRLEVVNYLFFFFSINLEISKPHS
jgi:hypothetical protein